MVPMQPVPFNGDFAGRFLKQNLDANGFKLQEKGIQEV